VGGLDAEAWSGVAGGQSAGVVLLTEQATPPPGFYDDGSGHQRYWDGMQWTERRPPTIKKAKNRPRKMTWVVVLWCILMAVWIIGAIVSANPSSNCAHGAYKSACEAGSSAGTGIGVVALWFIWFFGFVILSLIWFMSRPKGRICPTCGENVKKGRTTCPGCQFDFAAAVAPGPSMAG
jgi:hypothetical protein